VKRLPPRVPLLLLETPERVFDLRPAPAALLVDLEGTLTEFHPSWACVTKAVAQFDGIAMRNGLDVRQVHYVTNADFKEFRHRCGGISARIHTDALKPFFTPPSEFRLHGYDTVVVGDQYLTDGLLAWRFGFSFGLVNASSHQPAWPRAQRSLGHTLSHAFFRRVDRGP